MAGFKSDRLAQDIKRIVYGNLRELKDPRIKGDLLTIVRCEVSGDSSYCKIYVSSLEGYEASKVAVKGLESASGYLKREISNVLHLRKSPDLKFIADDSVEHSARINALLKDLDEKGGNKGEK